MSKIMTPQEAVRLLEGIFKNGIAPHITDEYLREEKRPAQKGFVLDALDDEDYVEPEDVPPPGYYYEG